MTPPVGTGAGAGPRFNRAILGEVAHRPWPMPDRPWVMTQTWHDLLFAHWPVDPAVLRPLVPSAFDLDRFDRVAWSDGLSQDPNTVLCVNR